MNAVVSIGMRFELLLVLDRCRVNGRPEWLCRCDCGATKTSRSYDLVHRRIRSCGCLQIELTIRRSTTHGLRHNREYIVLHNAITRCHNPDDPHHEYYGARGIVVCDRWRFGENGKTGIECFVADMGFSPSPKHELDRIDNDCDYSPDNCRWTTRIVQMRNTRRNRFVEYRGETVPISQAVEMAGYTCGPDTANGRIKRGWPVAKAVETPPGPRYGGRQKKQP